MKCLLITCLCLFWVFAVKGQDVDKYKLTSSSMVYKDQEGAFLYQEDWKPCNAVMVIAAKKNKATLYINDTEIEFDLLSAHMAKDDEESDAILKFNCVDNKGVKCGITLITLAHPINADKTFIKIQYNNVEVLYKFSS